LLVVGIGNLGFGRQEVKCETGVVSGKQVADYCGFAPLRETSAEKTWGFVMILRLRLG